LRWDTPDVVIEDRGDAGFGAPGRYDVDERLHLRVQGA
jgi:hypothetical protein